MKDLDFLLFRLGEVDLCEKKLIYLCKKFADLTRYFCASRAKSFSKLKFQTKAAA